jgi:hypothetical protein
VLLSVEAALRSGARGDVGSCPRTCENSVSPNDRRIIFQESLRLRSMALFDFAFRLLFRRIFHILTAMTGFHTAWSHKRPSRQLNLGPLILPFESHALSVEGDEAALSNSDPMHVARPLGEHRVGSAERRVGIDHSFDLAILRSAVRWALRHAR